MTLAKCTLLKQLLEKIMTDAKLADFSLNMIMSNQFYLRNGVKVDNLEISTDNTNPAPTLSPFHFVLIVFLVLHAQFRNATITMKGSNNFNHPKSLISQNRSSNPVVGLSSEASVLPQEADEGSATTNMSVVAERV